MGLPQVTRLVTLRTVKVAGGVVRPAATPVSRSSDMRSGHVADLTFDSVVGSPDDCVSSSLAPPHYGRPGA